MVTVHIESGICGFQTVVKAFKYKRKCTGIAIKSGCRQVTELGGQLPKLEMKDIMNNPINNNLIYKLAGKCNLHPSCPVPCGVIKAAEAELGLALKKDVTISFQDPPQEKSDAL